MSAEWVTALATAGTFVVIAASAGAALVQLSHMRRGNQIALLTSYNAELDSPEFGAAFQFVRQDLPDRRLTDEEIAAFAGGSFPGEFHAIRQVANLFENMGAFVATGTLNQEIICNLWALNVLNAWRSISPVITLIREANGRPQVWENFEYLAGLSQQYLDRHPHGALPKDALRMPPDDSLISRYRDRSK